MKKRNKKNMLFGLIMIMLLCTYCLMGCCDRKTNYEKYIEPTAEEYARMTPEEQVKEKVKKFHSLIVNGEFNNLTIEIYTYNPEKWHIGPIRNLRILPDIYKEEHENPDVITNNSDHRVFRYEVGSEDIQSNAKTLSELTSEYVSPFIEGPDYNSSVEYDISERVYYVIKNKNETLLEVSMWGTVTKERIPEPGERTSIQKRLIYFPCLIVNDVNIENEYVFAKIIIPFLPKSFATGLYYAYH